MNNDPPQAPPPPLWHLGACTADLQRQLLLRAEVPVRLRPKAWTLLETLLRRPNAVVRSDELLQALWPRQDINPKLLVNVVSELRAALGEPELLRSVPRRGFVLTATPARVQAPGQESTGQAAAEACGAPAPFVGREAALAVLRAGMARARRHQLQIIDIVGPPGVGKSALLAHWRAEVLRQGRCVVLQGRGLEMIGEREPFGPLLQMLEQHVRAAGPQVAVADLRRLAPCWLAQLPGLLSPAELAQLQHELYRAGTGRMLREALALLAHGAAQAPLLMLFDDVHWADTATLDFLGLVAQANPAQRLMVVVTRRPPAADAPAGSPVPGLQQAIARGNAQVLTLAGLAPQAVQAYLSTRWPALRKPTLLGQQLAEITAGLPLFLKLVVDELVGMAASDPTGSRVPLKLKALPAQLRQYVLDRALSLPLEARAVLDVACCMPVPVPVPVLAHTLDWPEAQVQRHSEQLVKLGLLQAGPRLLPWRDGRLVRAYGYAHALYRDVIHGELEHPLQMALNRRIAAALHESSPQLQAAEAPHLALAYAQADMHAEAAAALRLSCIRSLGRFATRHALWALQEALHHLEQVPDKLETRSLRLETCWDLSRLLLVSCSPTSAEVEAMRDKLLQLAPRVNTERARFLMHATQCARQVYGARADLAHEPLQKLLQASTGLSAHEQALAQFWRGVLAMAECRIAACRAALDACLALPLAGLGMAGTDIRLIAASKRVWALGVGGEFKAFTEGAAALEAQAHAGRNPYLQATALYWVAEALRLLDCSAGALHRYQQLLALNAAHDCATFQVEAQLGLQACLEPAARDVAALRNLATQHQNTGPAWSDHVLSTLLLPALLAQGRLAEAQQVLQDLAPVATQWPFYQSEKLRLEGDLAQACGQPGPALALWRQALALDIAHGYVPGLLRCLKRQPLRAAAHEHPQTAQALNTAVGLLRRAPLDHPDLQPLRALLEHLQALPLAAAS